MSDLSKPAKPWADNETWFDRARLSLSFLVVHGFIPSSQASKVRERIAKQEAAARQTLQETADEA